MSSMSPLIRHPLIGLMLIVLSVVYSPIQNTLLATERDPLEFLSIDERQMIRTLDRQMNAQRTLLSRFVQLNPDGNFVEGTLSMRRPDQARFEYDPPAPLLLIASGNFLIEVDRELEQVTYYPQVDSIATYLLGNDVLQNPDLLILGVQEKNNIIRVILQEFDAPENGKIRLEFDAITRNLRRWDIEPSDGNNTRLTLVDPRYNLELDDDQFHFTAPSQWTVDR